MSLISWHIIQAGRYQVHLANAESLTGGYWILIYFCLGFQVRCSLISTSPLNELDLARLLRIYGSKYTYTAEPFNDQEKELILAALSGQFKNIVQFAMWTGLRSSELIALSWDDVDLESGIVNIWQAKVENTLKGTKSKFGTRKVILLPKARIARIEQQPYTLAARKLVFHHPETQRACKQQLSVRAVLAKTNGIPCDTLSQFLSAKAYLCLNFTK